jgi:hypothetical protein
MIAVDSSIHHYLLDGEMIGMRFTKVHLEVQHTTFFLTTLCPDSTNPLLCLNRIAPIVKNSLSCLTLYIENN